MTADWSVPNKNNKKTAKPTKKRVRRKALHSKKRPLLLMSVTLSVAQLADIEAIDRCNRSVLPENYPRDFYEAFLQSPNSISLIVKPALEEEQEDERKAEEKTAAASDEIAGYILCMLQNDKKKAVVAHIYSIGVYPQFRRRGYASALLKTAEALLGEKRTDIKCISLHVRKKNKAARKFYAKLGFGRTKV